MIFLSKTEVARLLETTPLMVNYLVKKLWMKRFYRGWRVRPTQIRWDQLQAKDALILLNCKMKMEWELSSRILGSTLPPFPLYVPINRYEQFLKAWGRTLSRRSAALSTGLTGLPTVPKLKTIKSLNYWRPRRRRSTNTNSSNSWWEGP